MEFRETQYPASKLAAFLPRARSRSSTAQPNTKGSDFHKHRFSRYIPSRRLSKHTLLDERSLRPTIFSRNFNTCCERVLDAPGISKDFSSNIMSWDDHLAVALCSQLFIWAPLTGEIKSVLSNPCKTITSVVWKKGSGLLAFCDSKSCITTYDNSKSAFEKFPVSGLAYSQHYEGNMIVSGLDTGSIECLDVRAPRSRLIKKSAHLGPVTGISVTASELIASVGADQYLKLWDLRSEKPYFSKKFSVPIKAVKWHPSSPGVLAVGGESLFIIDSESIVSAKVAEIISGVDWNNSGTEIIGAVGKCVKVWTKRAVEVVSVEEHTDEIFYLAKSKDDEVVTGSLDETLRFWNLLRSS